MPKPLMFGDMTFDAERVSAIRTVEAEWDRSYVPGYGEARRDNELRVLKGKKALPIDRLQWIRVGHVDARDVGNKDMLEWAMLTYQFATPADLEERGWGMPPTAHVDSQGRIRREDLALAFVDAAQAEVNRTRQKEINADFHNSGRLASSGSPIEAYERTNEHGGFDVLDKHVDE